MHYVGFLQIRLLVISVTKSSYSYIVMYVAIW